MRISRRTMLRTVGASSILAVQQSAPAPAQPSRSAESIPPSIAALQSMRAQAQPISVEERQKHIARAQQLMAEHHIDAILLAGGTSLLYFTGVRWGNSERLFAVVLPAKGNAFCVCPSFEEGRAREQLDRGPLKSIKVMTWQEDENPYKLVAAGLRALGESNGILGIEERTPWVFSEDISKAAPALHLTSATPVTAGCRMIKTAHELALMQLANHATLKVYEAVYRALRPGMTQADALELVSAAYARVGFRGEASVEVGAYSANPHGSATPQVIREDTIVMIDDGCFVQGYQSDITRSFVLGKATGKMNRVFDIVKRAQSAALAAAKPGVACEDVDAAARKVIVDAGYGPGYKYFAHRVGHGIGMDMHEWPYLVGGDKLPIQAGMTFSDEPGIYIPGEFGIRLEDDMFITKAGAQLFTPQSQSLDHPFG